MVNVKNLNDEIAEREVYSMNDKRKDQKIEALELKCEHWRSTAENCGEQNKKLEAENAELRRQLERAKDHLEVIAQGVIISIMQKYDAKMERYQRERDEAREFTRKLNESWFDAYGGYVQPHIPTPRLLELAEPDEETGDFKYPIIGISVTVHFSLNKNRALHGATTYHSNDPKEVDATLLRASLAVAPIPEPDLVQAEVPASLDFLKDEEQSENVARMFRYLLFAFGDKELYRKERRRWWRTYILRYIENELTVNTAPKKKGEYQSDFYRFCNNVLEAHAHKMRTYVQQTNLIDSDGNLFLPMPHGLR